MIDLHRELCCYSSIKKAYLHKIPILYIPKLSTFNMVSFSVIASTALALASTQVAAAPSLQARQAPQGIAVLYGECTETGGTNGQTVATFAGIPACTSLVFNGIEVALGGAGCTCK